MQHVRQFEFPEPSSMPVAAPLWTDGEAARATGGTSTAPWVANGVSIDTRTLEAGDLFVALKDRRDGHDFVAEAFRKGASAALVTHRPEGVPEDAPLLVVPSVLGGLEALGRTARIRTAAKVIAVTGSVGKTGTKEMLRAALKSEGRVHAAERSYNNHWGVPLTLARMPENADFAVVEIGMNAPGEIAPLSVFAQPNVSLITTVEKVHMEAFRSIRDVAFEKAGIFEGMGLGGTAIINRDIATYPLLLREVKKRGLEPVRFGYAGRPEYWLRGLRLAHGDTTFIVRRRGENICGKINAPGRHLAMNAVAALAAAEAVGADTARAILGLGHWVPPEGRGNRIWIDIENAELEGPILVIDETYNANPTSMEAALDVLAATEPEDGLGRLTEGRRIAILGDMLEIGEEEQDAHAALARLDAIDGIDRIHTVGPRMSALLEALPHEKRGRHFKTARACAAMAPRLVDPGDVVMLKASNGTGLSRVVDALQSLGKVRHQGSPEIL